MGNYTLAAQYRYVCLPSCNTYRLIWVSLHICSIKTQPLLLTLDEEYLLTATPPNLERGIIITISILQMKKNLS